MFWYSWKRDRDDKKLYEAVEKICILISLLIIFMTIFIIFISNKNNCYLEKYEQYSCRGKISNMNKEYMDKYKKEK